MSPASGRLRRARRPALLGLWNLARRRTGQAPIAVLELRDRPQPAGCPRRLTRLVLLGGSHETIADEPGSRGVGADEGRGRSRHGRRSASAAAYSAQEDEDREAGELNRETGTEDPEGSRRSVQQCDAEVRPSSGRGPWS